MRLPSAASLALWRPLYFTSNTKCARVFLQSGGGASFLPRSLQVSCSCYCSFSALIASCHFESPFFLSSLIALSCLLCNGGLHLTLCFSKFLQARSLAWFASLRKFFLHFASLLNLVHPGIPKRLLSLVQFIGAYD